MQKPKVFRTPIGLHGAYVAVRSQKAALEVGGRRTNLFATGAAERVKDDELTREPLAYPGTVLQRPRSTMAKHFSALPKDSLRPQKSKQSGDGPADAQPTRAVSKPALAPKLNPKLKPDRAALAKAEAELVDATARHKSELAASARQQAELDRRRRAVENDQAREHRALERKLEAENVRFDRAMRAWMAIWFSAPSSPTQSCQKLS